MTASVNLEKYFLYHFFGAIFLVATIKEKSAKKSAQSFFHVEQKKGKILQVNLMLSTLL